MSYFTLQERNPDLHQHMREVATDALALADIALRPDVPVIEQLNGHDHPYIGDARSAILMTLATREAVQLVLSELPVDARSCEQ